MSFKYPLATSSWDDTEIAAIKRVISSDHYSMGREVSLFEEQFARYFGSRFAVMVNSGSSANLIMTAALFYTKFGDFKLERGDEIIVPAVSWSTTYYPLAQYGLRLKFVDIDLQTLNYDLTALNAAITENTRAVMIVNLLGNPNEFDKISEVIKDRNIILLEDNCESMGAAFDGKYTGTHGLLGSFSCFFSHHISTMEGGVIVTDDEELYHIMLSLRAHGWTRNLPKNNFVTGEKSDDKFTESFRFVLPGYNVRPLEMSGAIGQEQLKKLDSIIQGRRENGRKFVEMFSDNENIIIQKEIGASSWFGFSMIVKDPAKLTRSQLVRLLSENGFECRPIVSGNFAKNEVMRHFSYSVSGKLNNAEYLDLNGLFIGNHHYDMEEAFDKLKQLLDY